MFITNSRYLKLIDHLADYLRTCCLTAYCVVNMTSSNNRTKLQVTRELSGAAFVFEKAAEQWANIDETADLPEALYIAPQALAYIPMLLRSLEGYIIEIQEANALKEKYGEIYEFAELCQKQVTYFNSIFEAVTSSGKFPTRDEKYRLAAEKCGGLPIEVAVKELLQEAINLATLLSDEDGLKSELQAAFDKVDKLKPSLTQTPKGTISVNHYGRGNQFYHGGRGHQNHCEGGIQITGDNATNNLTKEYV